MQIVLASQLLDDFDSEMVDLATGAVVLDATAGSDAGIDVVSSEYATIAAEQSAAERLSEVVGALRWRFQRGPIPPGLRSYTRQPWTVANDKLKAEGRVGDISELKRAAREQGMRFLRESAVERVMDGLTTLREINKVTFVE